MDLQSHDVSKCQHPRKHVSEGLCLSYDLLRGLCLETMGPCAALIDAAASEQPE